MNNNCICDVCKSACVHKPGWFLPKELEAVAKYLNISEQELFDQYIGVDWYEEFDDIFVLAPAIVDMEPGNEYPGDPRGQCVFFNDVGLCSINDVKPFECKESMCVDDSRKMSCRHREIAKEWINNQDDIEKLLGREPESEHYEGDLLGLLGMWY